MDKFDALDSIKKAWNAPELSLGERIFSISTDFHSSGLDLGTTAAYINATPAELENFLSLGELDDDIINLISEVNPPKTAWTMLAEANEEEIKLALNALKENYSTIFDMDSDYTLSEFIFQKMIEISGPTVEQKIGRLSGNDIGHVTKKGKDFNVFTTKQENFMWSITKQRRMGKTLSDKQISYLKDMLKLLKNKGAITRNSIDGDQEICNRILDALEK